MHSGTLRAFFAVLLLVFLSSTGMPAGEENLITKPWTGDYDGMAKRRLIRILVPYSKTFYFVDKGAQKGTAYELGKLLEDAVNKGIKSRSLKMRVAFVPVSRDQLLPDLIKGRGDIASGALTATEERLDQVDFADPWMTGVNELVVTSANAPAIHSKDDLSGKEIYVGATTSYFQSLQALNEEFKKVGKPPVIIKPADENLETEDILEMVNGGLISMTIADSYLADFWKQVFPNIRVTQVAVRIDAQIAWAIRKNSPQLKALLNPFVAKNKKGTATGNTIFQRYLKNTKYVKNATAESERKKLQETIEFFKKYAGQYGFDWLMVAAQGYQESGLDQSVRSPVGAIGVMQVMPATARDRSVNIPNIEDLEPNIHAGVKYMRFMMDEYFTDAQMDQVNKGLFAFASYNAGPNRIARLRKVAEKEGLNPNIWFHNVELIVAREVGREPVQYVSNIYKYYVAYKLILEQADQRKEAERAIRQSSNR